jgi:CubicO group peptidase (beta-lactamase class C family)
VSDQSRSLPDRPRSLPDRPSLRYLKLEAKRRLAAGEFESLHLAQLAIAREHHQPSWTALKEAIEAQSDPAVPALTHVRWALSRFRRAGRPGWAPPDEGELREHFDERYLMTLSPEKIARTLTDVAPRLDGELVVETASARGVRAQISGMRLEALTEPAAPHRLIRLHLYPLAQRLTDPRVGEPATRTSGAPPAPAIEVAEQAYGELGLPGLVVAGSADTPTDAGVSRGDGIWTAARGWAELDTPRRLEVGAPFPVYAVAMLITSTAVLRLVAEGQVALDRPANSYLSALRLAGDDVTVRELLSHTGGVDSPDERFAAAVPDLVSVLGPVVPCGGERGSFRHSSGGYGALGQLIADVTGEPYPRAAARLVLGPLRMADSSFPATWPGTGPGTARSADPGTAPGTGQDIGAVAGYRLADDGAFESVPPQVSTIPAAAGLWSTAADLVCFGRGWAGLLPADLAREALRPHATQGKTRAQVGLGWLLNPAVGFGGHMGYGPAAAASLIVRLGDGRASVALTNRTVPIETVNVRMLRAVP